MKVILKRDHPRACGEKVKWHDSDTGQEGSPPRMRGKGIFALFTTSIIRITPAHAGKSSPLCLCGYNALGSPPRMRGKARQCYSFATHCRITPAHAGKRRADLIMLNKCRDHPRACGEKPCHLARLPAHRGSPPRMRGKEHRIPGTEVPVGITPAHAGKSGS